MDRFDTLFAIKTANCFFQHRIKNAPRSLFGLFSKNSDIELKKIEALQVLLNNSSVKNPLEHIIEFLNQKESARFHPYLIWQLFKSYGVIISLKKASESEAKDVIIQLLSEKITPRNIPNTIFESPLEDLLRERIDFLKSDAFTDDIKSNKEISDEDLLKDSYNHFYRIIQMPWEKIKLDQQELKYINALREIITINDETEYQSALQKLHLISLKQFHPTSKQVQLELLDLYIHTLKDMPLAKSSAFLTEFYSETRRCFVRLFPVKRINLDPSKVTLADVTKWSVHNPYNRKFTDSNLQLYGSYDHFQLSKNNNHQHKINNNEFAAVQNEEEFNRINEQSYLTYIEAPARAIVKTLYNHEMQPFYSNACCALLHKGVWWKNSKTNQFFFSSFAHQQTYRMMDCAKPNPLYTHWLVFWKNPISLPFDLPWPNLEIFLKLDGGPRITREDEDGFLCTKFVLIENIFGEEEILDRPLDGSRFANLQMV